MDKRGQFYLLAAFVIIVILISIVSVKNSVIGNYDRSYDQVYNLIDELNVEGAKVIDYGIYNDKSLVNTYLEDWIDEYTQYSQSKIGFGEGAQWIFVYGDQSDLQGLILTQETESITVDLGTGGSGVKITKLRKDTDGLDVKIKTGDGVIEVTDPEGVKRIIELKEGQIFYFILSVGGEEGETIVGESEKSVEVDKGKKNKDGEEDE